MFDELKPKIALHIKKMKSFNHREISCIFGHLEISNSLLTNAEFHMSIFEDNLKVSSLTLGNIQMGFFF